MQFDTIPANPAGFSRRRRKKDTLSRVLNCPQRPLAFGAKKKKGHLSVSFCLVIQPILFSFRVRALAGAVGRATARVAPTQKFVLGRHTQKFLLTPGEKSDTLNAIQAMMGVAARSCGRKCPPDAPLPARECGAIQIQVEPRTKA